MKKIKIFYWYCTIIFCWIAAMFYSCRKTDLNIFYPQATEAMKARFFNLLDIPDSITRSFAAAISAQNDKYNFIGYFIQNNGYPNWQSVEVKSESLNGRAFAFIPFSLEGQSETNGFIVCRRNAANKYAFVMYRKADLAYYGYAPAGHDSLDAQQVQMVLNHFNYKNFGIESYKITDLRMLADSAIKSHPYITNPKNVLGHLKNNKGLTQGLKPINGLGGGGSSPQFQLETCYTFTEETDWWYNPDGDACNCDGDEFYSYTSYNSYTACTTDDDFDLYHQQTMWWIGQQGGGGGGGGGGSSPTVRDSTYFKDLLHTYAMAISNEGDNIYMLAKNSLFEWGFMFVKNVNYIIQPRNTRTDSLNGFTVPLKNFTLGKQETLIGQDHAHTGEIPSDTADANRSSISIGDIIALKSSTQAGTGGKRLSSIQDFVSFVETGTVRQAIVVEDPDKANAYINSITDIPTLIKTCDANSQAIWNANGRNNFRQASLQALLALLGNSATTGIGIYRSIDAAKTQFVKLN